MKFERTSRKMNAMPIDFTFSILYGLEIYHFNKYAIYHIKGYSQRQNEYTNLTSLHVQIFYEL